MTKTFEQLAADPIGTTYVDRFDEGIRVVVLRGPGSLCAYLGIPITHPLAGNSYDNVPIDCHGGLTFAGEGNGEYLPKGFFWYGWDYNHCDDFAFYYLTSPSLGVLSKNKQWTVELVEKDLWGAMYGMKRLMAVAENAFAKGAGWRAE